MAKQWVKSASIRALVKASAIVLAGSTITKIKKGWLSPPSSTIMRSIFCVFLGLSFSCDLPEKGLSQYLHYDAENYSQEINIELDSIFTFKVKNPQDTFLYIRPFFYNDRIYALQKSDKYIVCSFTLKEKTKELEFSFEKDSHLPEANANFFVFKDSIFIVNQNYEHIIVGDIKSGTISTFEISNEGWEEGNKFSSLTYMPYYTPQHSKRENKIFFNIVSVDYLKTGIYQDWPLFAVASLSKNSVIPVEGFSKGILREKKQEQYPYDLAFPYFLLSNDTLIINYPLDHNVFLLDIGEKKIVDVKKVASNTVLDLPLPLNRNSMTEMQEMWNFSISNAFYEPMFFHEEVKLYSRAIHHTQPLKLHNGMLNDGRNRITALIIMDENFSKVGEHLFTNGEYLWHGAIPTPDGFLLYSKKYDHDEYKIPNKKYVFRKASL